MKQNRDGKHDLFTFRRAEKNDGSVRITSNRHYHSRFEIYCLESGICHYFIDNKSYELLPGDLAIIPAGVIHNTMYQKSRYTRLLLNFPAKYIPTEVMPLLKSIGYLYRNPDISRDIFDLLYRIEEESREENPFSDQMIGCYMNQLFFLLARNRNCYDDTRVRKEYIEGAIAFVQEHFTDVDLSLGQTARRFSVSPEHFSREFKKETGFGFCEYVNLLRIKKAESLLKTRPDLSVTEVSSQCGFNDSNYFSVKFKKMYGVSPKKIQKSGRGVKQ